MFVLLPQKDNFECWFLILHVYTAYACMTQVCAVARLSFPPCVAASSFSEQETRPSTVRRRHCVAVPRECSSSSEGDSTTYEPCQRRWVQTTVFLESNDARFLLLLLGLFPSSGVAGMVMYIIIPLCHVQHVLLV